MGNMVKTKARPRMKYEWTAKKLKKKPIQKKRKKNEDQNETAAWEQKTTSEKTTFCSNTNLSLYSIIRMKILHAI